MSSRDAIDLEVLKSVETSLDSLNRNFEKIEELSSRISIYGNTKSQLFNKVEIEVSSSIKLAHGLDVVPSFRLIVRQSSGGAILDGEWTNKTVEFKNNASSRFVGDILVLGG